MSERVGSPANQEQLRVTLEQKIEHHLETEPAFSGARYTGLDLSPADFSQWEDRPLISGAIEPFTPREDIRIILTDHLTQKDIETYKTMQLRIAPIEKATRIRYVYHLRLAANSLEQLKTYIDKPATPQIGDKPAPMLPYNITEVRVTPSVLEAFSNFLDQAKPISQSK